MVKNCPFCGSNVHPYQNMKTGKWGIQCESYMCFLHDVVPSYNTEKALITAWNKRFTK